MKRALAIALTALAYSSTSYAEATRFHNLEGFGSFLDGNPESTAVTEDGLITLPPIAKERFSDASVSFTAATAKGDDVIAAKAGSNVVVAIDKNGKSRDLATLENGVITCLLATDDGVFAAAGPSAKIYKLNGKGKADVFYKADTGFIWAMTPAPGGGLYIATGDPGKVYKVDKGGKATELWASDQQHLRSIAYAKDMGIFVGGGEHGILFKSNGEKDFRALFDSGHPEITAIVARDGYAYVAGVSGADAVASDDDSGSSRKGKGSPVRSQLVRVSMTGASETLAGSNDEGIFALAFDGSGNILVATGAAGRDDPRGRLYSVAPSNREISMIYQAKSRRITHLVDLGDGSIAAVASAGGRIIQVTGPAAQSGEFMTVAYDAGINASFGVVQLYGNVPSGTTATIAARSGQTATPDAAWSAWSKEISYPGGVKADVPNGRFIQLRVTLGSSGKEVPRINRVRIAYLRQNLRPFVREVVALRKGVALIGVPREEQKSKTVSLAEKATEEMRRGENPTPSNTSTRARQVEQRGALTVRWVAEDPNGDELKYNLDFRTEGRNEWRTLNKDLDEPFYTVQSAQLPDGHYQFRVRATDEPSNPRGAELEDKRESTSVLVDNSPPRVSRVTMGIDGKKATAKVDVADSVGPIIGAEYAVDGGVFKPMAPADGVLDGAAETFEVRLPELDRGTHTFTVRVIDEAENEGFGESNFVVR
ncbi:MAG: hypothetical protein H7Z43_15945 [Clostridia bacterium]|nr:hypothetical protein [Deltaproteobacteria bacterium]